MGQSMMEALDELEKTTVRVKKQTLQDIQIGLDSLEALLHESLQGYQYDPSWMHPVKLPEEKRKELFGGACQFITKIKSYLQENLPNDTKPDTKEGT